MGAHITASVFRYNPKKIKNPAMRSIVSKRTRTCQSLYSLIRFKKT